MLHIAFLHRDSLKHLKKNILVWQFIQTHLVSLFQKFFLKWRRQKRLKLQLFKQKQKQRVRYTVLHIKKIIINL